MTTETIRFRLDKPPQEFTAEGLLCDPLLIGLPSGAKVSARNVQFFNPHAREMGGRCTIFYRDGRTVMLADPDSIAAFDAALSAICVHVKAPV